MPSKLLDGPVILVLEDEYLIAMDVEHLCLEHGAAEVVVMRSVEGATAERLHAFDVAVVDLMLDGVSTLPFAAELEKRGIPFVFASGYADRDELASRFPAVPAVAKPYAGDDLIEAMANVYRRLGKPKAT